MKAKLITVILILMAFGILAVRAQNAIQPQASPGPPAQQLQPFTPGDPSDPKISPEQKDQLQKAGSDNPSRPVIKDDPRSADFQVDPEKSSGSSNARPAVTLVTDPREEEQSRAIAISKLQVIPATSSSKAQEQPEGKKPATVTDFRKTSGKNEQPAPPPPGKTVNYRELKGPNEQPAGVDPKKGK